MSVSNFSLSGLPGRPMSAGMMPAPSGGAAVTPASLPTPVTPTGAMPATASAPFSLQQAQTELAQLQQQLALIQKQAAALIGSLKPGTPSAPHPAPTPAKPAPKPAPKPVTQPAAPRGYTVQSGDTLFAIAQRTLGDGSRWKEIYDLNRGTMSDPNVIYPGEHLKLPSGSTPAPKPPVHKPTPKPPVHTPAPHGPNTSRGIYLAQPNGWTCGPTSLTMALAAWGVRPSNTNTMNEMVRLTGANANVGVPGNASLIADAAKKVGMQAKFNPVASPANVRAALKAGHGVVLNGSLGVGGHFIYVAGLNPDGSFIIDDPARSSVTRMTDSELNAFANTYSNPRGFAEIWK